MTAPVAPLGLTLEQVGELGPELEVALSHELVGLLSEQLYQSPIKAIEELVVNSYDADAKECRILVPDPPSADSSSLILVFDDGIGMDDEGLRDLWHVGHSSKRQERIAKLRKRKQIGKFGIGKLSTYAIAGRVTYITKAAGQIRSTSVDYSRFGSDPTGGRTPVKLPVAKLTVDQVLAESRLNAALEAAGVDLTILGKAESTWTVVILEQLKGKAAELRHGRLRWVLSTAMPLRDDFQLYLNREEVKSSKEEYEVVAQFQVSELPEDRIAALSKANAEPWRTDPALGLVSPSFPSGVNGEVMVTRQSLYAGKSADLLRSHGFFIRVLGRLINMEDPLFGLKPLSYETFNRFRADLTADDLDAAVTAPREGVEWGQLIERFQRLLGELYYEARSRYEAWNRDAQKPEKTKREHERNYVDIRFVERPIADAISAAATAPDLGPEADEGWFYLQLPEGADIRELARGLYADVRKVTYRYERTQQGRSSRLVAFDPEQATFQINADHDLVKAYDDDGPARLLLEDVVTAEALLEVYLRAEGLPAHQVGEVLEKRDQLLRGLSRDRVYSLSSIASDLRDASNDEHDLEVSLVIACRALGFVAKHISGGDEPDGIARFLDYPLGDQKITLEAKSSQKVPSLGAIDFAGLARHVSDYEADGCLLVAPSYPGGTRGSNAAAARSANDLRISCWTVDQLARVVRNAESRHLTARHVLDIVLHKFTPDDVTAAVENLLQAPTWRQRDLYIEILTALRSLEGRLPDSPRTVSLVAGEVSRHPEFAAVKTSDVERAIRELAGGSQGALALSGDRLLLNTSLDELGRRLTGVLGAPGTARRESTFHT